MESSDYFSIGLSVFALGLSILSLIITTKYSKINFLYLLERLVTERAKECNLLWKKAFEESRHPQENVNLRYTPIISEIIVSIQLLDNSLKEYSQMEKRNFFIKQFWIQLDTPLREYFKNWTNVLGYDETTKQQISDIKRTFNFLFDSY